MGLPSQPVTLTVEQLAELNRSLSNMRHDINNHLSLIMAAVELIRHKPQMAERMLTTLETGVKGGRWHTLIDKVFAMPTLQHAAFRVVAKDGAAGVDHVSANAFKQRMDRERPFSVS